MKRNRVELRVGDKLLEKIDRYRKEQDDFPSRGQAIRELVELGLKWQRFKGLEADSDG